MKLSLRCSGFQEADRRRSILQSISEALEDDSLAVESSADFARRIKVYQSRPVPDIGAVDIA